MVPVWLAALLNYPVLGTLLKLVLLVALFVIVRHFMYVAQVQLERRLQSSVQDKDRRDRLNTLLRAGYGSGVGLLALITVAMALHLLGLNIGPLLASAGVVGLAISLGAQSLIRDYISGVLILAEDQFRVGDLIEVAGVSGEVAEMTLRVTYLRDPFGKLHSVPNGDIRVISNVTRDWSRAVVDLNLPLGTDMAVAEAALRAAVAKMRTDPALKDLVLGEPEVIPWNSVSDTSVQVRLTARTTPGEQAIVARALRRVAAQALGVSGAMPGSKNAT
jgi:moderate conductance mechanosensitive channel